MRTPIKEYLPEGIMANLRKYKEIESAVCPRCGYVGAVGMMGTHWWGGVAVTILGIVFFFCPIGWILIGLKILLSSNKYQCPNCETEWHD